MIERITDGAYLVNTDTTPYIKFDKFDGLDWMNAGFSTRYGGVSKGCFESMSLSFGRGDPDENIIENFRLLGRSAGFDTEQIVLPNQQHTTEVRVASLGVVSWGRGQGFISTRPDYPADGQVTNEPGTVLIVYGADCVPVYLCDPVNKAVGACHAGWKGTLGNIPQKTVELMQKSFGSRPEDIIAVIGPSICMDCYEVSADVAEQFIERFEAEGISCEESELIKRVGISAKKDNNYAEAGRDSEKYLLNLWAINRQNLIMSGLLAENIDISGVCTKCRPDMLFSHRAHGDKRGTNAGFIFIR
ncbi:MAG: peptidoglycan editing factor PgeF [Lachnospiraceae bacterium]|nr:peptidoglycan editing factor PgeF [Lachnospiraceae bacterium]